MNTRLSFAEISFYPAIDSKGIQFTKDEFIVVASKKAISEEGEREFISFSKGFTKNGERKFKQTVTIPPKRYSFASENLEKQGLKSNSLPF